MRSIERILVLLLSALALFEARFALAETRADGQPIRYRSDAAFVDVFEDTKLAVTNRGLKINGISYIGKMLARTGGDVGSSRKIYRDARTIEFCSATESRRMMEADPHNAVFCPYAIAVYETEAEPGVVYVAYRAPGPGGSAASREALARITRMLDEIAREGAGR
ncbi:MAG: DUF302 domain-containing protein [Burkholderiaceae bacterium]